MPFLYLIYIQQTQLHAKGIGSLEWMAGAYPGVRLYAKTSTSFSQKKRTTLKKKKEKKGRRRERAKAQFSYSRIVTLE